MINNERLWYLWLSSIEGIGAVKTERLMEAFKYGERIYRADEKELMEKGGISAKDAAGIKKSSNKEYFKKHVIEVLRKCAYSEAEYICRTDSIYPEKLKNIYDTPAGLFFRGRLPNPDRPSVAIVGARECSSYGRAAADYLARGLAVKGIQIISGMARGIDSVAHEAALNAGGDTFAVMGCGIDICYPAAEIELYERIRINGGIISEYPPGVRASTVSFPMRNRIISGLCDVVIVVEAREKSGSLITADLALEQGKEVMAVPGRITDRLSFGCNELIKNGAVPVTDISDVERVLESLITGKALVTREMTYSKNKANSVMRGEREAGGTVMSGKTEAGETVMSGKSEAGETVMSGKKDAIGTCITEKYITGEAEKNKSGEVDKNKFGLESYEKIVYDRLCLKPKHVEEISSEAGIRYQDTKSILMKLTLYGIADQVARDYYVRC